MGSLSLSSPYQEKHKEKKTSPFPLFYHFKKRRLLSLTFHFLIWINTPFFPPHLPSPWIISFFGRIADTHKIEATPSLSSKKAPYRILSPYRKLRLEAFLLFVSLLHVPKIAYINRSYRDVSKFFSANL
jgi:hypothetical protein